ncbi:MAG TPA: hypothetical protein PLP27_02675 [Crocinitomicaceae bacterium]|nr:hypothetical protein [Crocinitomicaceae bacterium]
MKSVSIKSIEKAIEKVDNLDDDGLEKIATYYTQAQPVLLGYAGQAATEYENPDLEGLLIYYFCLIAEAFQQEGLTPKQVTEDMIDEFEEPFFEALDEFFNTENIEVLGEFSGQMDLIHFMTIEISVPDNDGTELDEETATQLFVVTSAITTLLGKACE